MLRIPLNKLLVFSVLFFSILTVLNYTMHSLTPQSLGNVLAASDGNYKFAYYRWTCADGKVQSGKYNCLDLQTIIQSSLVSCGECADGSCKVKKVYAKFLCKNDVSPCTNIDDNGVCSDSVVTPTVTQVPTLTEFPSTSTPSPTSPPTTLINLINNPDFESINQDWRFFSNGNSSFTIESSEEGGNWAKVRIIQLNSNIQLYQTNVALKPNTKYLFSFDGRATKTGNLPVYIHKHDSPYTNYGLKLNAELTTNWQTFSTNFISSSTASSDARLRFWFSPTNLNSTDWNIDNIQLIEQ